MTDTAVEKITDREAPGAEAAEPYTPAPRGRGRHRKPRPRKVLLAAGGLALAAGVLSLVRMAPDSGVAGVGTAEADPGPDAGGDRSTGAAATVAAVPGVSPSSTSVLGAVSTTPPPGVSFTPASSASATAVPSAAAPAADTPTATPTTAPRSPATSAAPQPTLPAPAPSSTTASPAPQPEQPGGPGLCVPIIGLCVDPLTTAAH
ncbi:hypothetical protein ABZY09_28895 [Streptomyces sp. NPDC002928]|uniref:hypothetical protein n=1 Tax=Streptomyces sp. NPDC002928 TaxID=3154440 RepID=UPI0033B5408E